MSRPVAWVGNDVVDLAAPRTHGRAADVRFVERVCDPREIDVIGAAVDPDLELWCHWAAKEAGYKMVSKLLGAPPPFAHRRFRVEWRRTGAPPGGDGGAAIRVGRVLYEAGAGGGAAATGSGTLEAPVRVHLLPDRALHAMGLLPATEARAHTARSGETPAAVAEGEPELLAGVAPLRDAGAPWSGPLDELLKRFSAREADAVYSQASAAVRLAARSALAARLALDEARLEIVCAPGPTSQRIPSVLVDGDRARADVSLSHDGRWIAWAIAAPPLDRPDAR